MGEEGKICPPPGALVKPPPSAAEALKQGRADRARIARSARARDAPARPPASPNASPRACSRAAAPVPGTRFRIAARASCRRRRALARAHARQDFSLRRQPILGLAPGLEAAPLGAVVRRLGDPGLDLLARRRRRVLRLDHSLFHGPSFALVGAMVPQRGARGAVEAAAFSMSQDP